MKTSTRPQAKSTPPATATASPAALRKRKGNLDWYDLYTSGSVNADEFLIPDHPIVEVKKYDEGTWVVLFEGMLLVMTNTARGAKAVKRVIDALSMRIKEMKGAAITETITSLVKAPTS